MRAMPRKTCSANRLDTERLNRAEPGARPAQDSISACALTFELACFHIRPMLTRLMWFKRPVGWLGLVLFLAGPFEALTPDDCDGHVVNVTVGADHSFGPDHTPSSGHPSSAPHTCHDLHNHGGFAVVDTPALIPPATFAAIEEATARVHPTAAAHETFRPPIA